MLGMKKLILIASLLLSSNSYSMEKNEHKTPCSEDENIKAYLFGQRIIDTVRNKDLDGLFSVASSSMTMTFQLQFLRSTRAKKKRQIGSERY